MPRRPPVPCNALGCKELISPGERYCSKHTRQVSRDYDRTRPSRSKRGYDEAHYRLRKMVMAEQPLCLACQAEGRVEPGVEMDHIDGNPWNRERDNLQMLCKRHHSQKTAREKWHNVGR